MNKLALAIHGGAGTILKSAMTEEKELKYSSALQEALDIGIKLLEEGATSLDVVEACVMSLEDCPLFNAGKGSVFDSNGKHEMDASIMRGSDREAGAVSSVVGLRNPIKLAKTILEKSDHVMLNAEGAASFAKLHNLPFENPAYFHDDFRYNQWQSIKDTDAFQLDHSTTKEQKFGTVGAVALDVHGNVAAATSTGGMTNKKFGRVGDSPIIGAGTYASNETCAVSCTGSGEYFIRGVVAYDVSCLMEYKGCSLQEACDIVVHERLPKINGDGGLIAIDCLGNVCLPFNTEGMYRGLWTSGSAGEIKIYK